MRRDLRLFAGTGVLGGYTTYSSLAVDTDGLIAAQDVGLSILYAAATIVVGAAASVAGIAVASVLARRRAARGTR
jgi:CrcB protein